MIQNTIETISSVMPELSWFSRHLSLDLSLTIVRGGLDLLHFPVSASYFETIRNNRKICMSSIRQQLVKLRLATWQQKELKQAGWFEEDVGFDVQPGGDQAQRVT